MLKTCLLILVFLATDMVAQSRPVSIASNFDDLYFALQDDPAAMKKWAEVQIQKLGPGMDLERAKMVATYAAACLELRCPPDEPLNAPKSLMVALQSAKRFQDATLIIRLEILILRMGMENKETKAVEKEYERILSLAKDLGSSRLQGEVLREMSALVERTDNLPLALRQIQQALVLSTKDAQPDDLIAIMIQYDAAIHFRRVNETDRAKELYQNVLNFAKKHKIRYFTGTSLLNFARSKISSNDPAAIREADLLLMEAEKLMTGVDVAEPMAYINLSRGDIAYKRKSFAEALRFFDKALVIYKQIHAQIWVADVHHWRAITLYEMGRFPEALDADKQAEEIFPKNFTTDHQRLALSKGKILHKMRLFEESIQELYRALKLKDDMIKEFSAKNLDRLKVELQVRSKEQQNELLKLDNALKEKELEHALFIRWIAIALLGLSALSLYLFHKSHRQARRLNRAQTEIQKILDNIEEGIISIKRDRHVETSLSPYINELLHLDGLKNGDFFGQVLSQLNIPQYEKDLVPEVINTCIGENRLTWDLNSHQLPIEAHMNDGSSRVLSLRWKCIFTDDDLVDQIILVMRDETVRKSLELNLVMEREVNQRSLERLLELAGQNPAHLNRFFQRVDQNIAQAVKNILPQKKWAEFMQGVHTIKGEARTLGLKHLAGLTHALESTIELLPAPGQARENFAATFNDWQKEITEYRKLWGRLYSEDNRKQSPSCSPFSAAVLEILQGFTPQLKNHGLSLKGIHTTDDVMTIPDSDLDSIRTILLHAIGNCIDHGYALPIVYRGFQTHDVQLDISLLETKDELELLIKDRGAGLDLAALRRKAEQRDIQMAHIEDVVFMPGFSTAQQVSDTSGRGVGLSAIKDLADKLQAKVSIRNREEGGSVLRVSWRRMRTEILAAAGG